MPRIAQLDHPEHGRSVAMVDEPHLRLLRQVQSTYQLAMAALERATPLRQLVEELATDERLSYEDVYIGQAAWKLLPPIDHPQPHRCLVTGTGMTHKGSALNRQAMHLKMTGAEIDSGNSAKEESPPALTDSMKMFQMALSGGRPAPGEIGVAPEWYYKGIGTILRAHNEPLTVPPHALDGGEEAEIAGVYVIAADGTPCRIGLAQGNEFSDHVLEGKNYLYTANSKLIDCSLGPELVIDADFEVAPGQTQIERDGRVIWQGRQDSGDSRMSHTLANLEHHHFKHLAHRHPGDLHVHYLGADEFSFKDQLRLEDGDIMQISYEGFGRPLRNPVRFDRSADRVIGVRSL